MGIEIERKFLVDHAKWKLLSKPAPTHLKQGYLLKEKDKTIRIRIGNEKAWLTIKGITTGISRSEYEYEIAVNDATEMLGSMASAIIEKKRYDILFAGKLWQVDVFEGDNDGLIVAEIELKSQAEEFEVPDWVTQDVSNDGRYFNSSLAANPFKLWQI